MRLADLIVDKRWAMTMAVRFCIRRSIASWTRRSDSVSSAEVASSRMRIGGFLRIARAIDKRWR